MKKFMISLLLAALMVVGIMVSVDGAVVSGFKNVITISGGIEYGDLSRLTNALNDLKMGNSKELHLMINSGGGHATAVLSMKYLLEHILGDARLVTHVTDMAYSGGAMLFLLGDVRIMHERSTIMVHYSAMYDQNGNKLPKSRYTKKQRERCKATDEWIDILTWPKTTLPKSYLKNDKIFGVMDACKYGVATHVKTLKGDIVDAKTYLRNRSNTRSTGNSSNGNHSGRR